MATEAQINANRRNAFRSTGPKSKDGKRASSENARTHGLYSASSILPDAELALFEPIRDHLLDLYQQPGDAEALRLIHEIALAQFRRELVRSMSLSRIVLRRIANHDEVSACYGEELEDHYRNDLVFEEDARSHRMFDRYFKMEAAFTRHIDKTTRELVAHLETLTKRQDETKPISDGSRYTKPVFQPTPAPPRPSTTYSSGEQKAKTELKPAPRPGPQPFQPVSPSRPPSE
jgi:hypothetical protein